MKTKIISILILISITFSFVPQPVYAGAWGEDTYASILKEMLEEMYLKIKETVIANLKIAAIRVVQARLNSLIGGGGAGGPKFVTDWRDEIYGSAKRQSDIVVNNYFSELKSKTPGSQGQQIVAMGEKIYKTDYTDPSQVVPDIDKYKREGLSGSPNAFWRYFLKVPETQNQPFTYSMAASEKAATEYSEKSGTEAAKNIAFQGVKGTEEKSQSKLIPGAVTATSASGGKYTKVYNNSSSTAEKKITMPGSIIGDIWSEVQNMPTKMLTLARSIPEIASAMVSQMITQMIQQGVTNINSQIDSQISNVMGQSGMPISQIQNFIQSGGKNLPNIPNMPSIPNIPNMPNFPK